MAFDGKSLAADRQVGHHKLAIKKIWRLKDGSLFSGCGLYDQMVEVVEWLDKGAKEDKKPWLPNEQESVFVLVSAHDGRGYWLTYPYLRRIPFTEKFFAIGSGSEYAMGAMAAGLGAKRAVEIAALFDRETGKGVDSVRLPKRTAK